ncbi:MAG: 50S ribosomal protein L6 [Dehalococcoidia bacterium]|nr:50S ribosomal protein L6 [Dehalococcoidia bacterium]MSQ17603.1 50S ribosomal protein L6 [Dehalococcoidia bacterium]
MSGSSFVREKAEEKTLSHLGRKPISIPRGVQVDFKPGLVTVKGPKGTVTQVYHPDVKVRVEGDTVVVERLSDAKFHRALHGLTRSLIANAIIGANEGYTKTMELMGVGYRVAQQGQGILLSVGMSHQVDMQPPVGVTMRVEGNNRIHINGADKQKVGQLAAQVRRVRPPNPYKEKGIKYQGEVIHLKPGKAAARKA